MSSRQPIERELTVLGSPSVGKSALIVRFTKNIFPDDYVPTIQDRVTHSVVHNNTNYQLTIYDTAGLDEHSFIPEHYIYKTHGYILVYSISDEHSFEVIQDIYTKLVERHNRKVPVVLVANKSDLADDERVVTNDDGISLAKTWNVPFIEASAKFNKHVNDVYTSCLNLIDPVVTIDKAAAASQAKNNNNSKNQCIIS